MSFLNKRLILLGCIFSITHGCLAFDIPQNRVMTVMEFQKALDNNEFLQKEGYTTRDIALDQYEIELINLALANQSVNLGGYIEPGRELEKFTGSTLLVGGGKLAGPNGENDGKTIVVNHTTEIQAIQSLVNSVKEDSIESATNSQRVLSDQEKHNQIQQLQEKIAIYQLAAQSLNNDLLARYFTLNIEPKIAPDMLASVVSESDMSKIPDNKFINVEFENVPCDVFLDPQLYRTLERITQSPGSISFSISYPCRRLIVPVIEKTKYGKEFKEILHYEVYQNIKKMDPHYGAATINLSNI